MRGGPGTSEGVQTAREMEVWVRSYVVIVVVVCHHEGGWRPGSGDLSSLNHHDVTLIIRSLKQ